MGEDAQVADPLSLATWIQPPSTVHREVTMVSGSARNQSKQECGGSATSISERKLLLGIILALATTCFRTHHDWIACGDPQASNQK